MTGGAATRGANMLRAAFSAEDLRIIVEEAHEAERRVVAHCHGGPGTRYAAEAGVDTLEHGVYVPREDLEVLGERVIPLVITFGVYERGVHAPGLDHQKKWDFKPMKKKGEKVLVKTPAGAVSYSIISLS